MCLHPHPHPRRPLSFIICRSVAAADDAEEPTTAAQKVKSSFSVLALGAYFRSLGFFHRGVAKS